MMDFTVIRRTLENFLRDSFTACPVQQENTKLDTSSLKDWIAVFDKATGSESTGMNEESYQLGGVLTIKIFTQLNTGTARAREIAQELTDLLNSTEINGIQIQTPELYPGPDDKHWYRHHLMIRYSVVMGQESSC